MNSEYFKRLLQMLEHNFRSLSTAEQEIYLKHISARRRRQMNIIFVNGLIFTLLGVASTWLQPAILGNTLAIIFLLTASISSILLFNVIEFLPFKVTRTATLTLYRWRTRQAPEWMYRAHKEVGGICLLYGDALCDTSRTKSKPDL
jgi:hypothetical protein